LDYIYWVL